ncbi:hypothetical protein [Pantoea sp. Cy-639]|uniref:hypothetical protein n=1 Tax=Pantoea sp. Cy-639 TaxID=2608360 RepID=UPI001964B722|nr:hypothetical protein [Pantoea sp. Cy-639]NIF17639.1 hypothetical protein [Pantoea sp. Cy-639]
MRMMTLLGLLAACVLAGLVFTEQNTVARTPQAPGCTDSTYPSCATPRETRLAACKAQMKKLGHDAQPRMQYGFCYIDALTPDLSASLAAGAKKFRPPPVVDQYVSTELGDFTRLQPTASPASIEARRQALTDEFNSLWPMIDSSDSNATSAQGRHIVQVLKAFNERWWKIHAESFHAHLKATQRLCQAHADSCVMGAYN